MIIYKPVPKNKTAPAAAVILILSSLILTGASFALPGGSLYMRMTALLFILLALLTGERYLNCSYTYILEETDLVIRKNSLRKSITVCRIEYSGIHDIIKKQALKKDNRKKDFTSSYNYCITMFYSDVYCILFDNGKENAVINFEPDGYFLSELKKRTKADEILLGL